MSVANRELQQQVSEGYQQTEIGVIPDEWNVFELGMITQNQRPISYGIVQTGPRINGGVKCLRVVDISNGVISKNDLITTTIEISNSYKRTQLQLDDLVIPLRGKVGEVGIVDEDLVGENLTRGVALIALKEAYCAQYIKQIISFEGSAKRLENSMNGSALQEISIAVLRSFKVIVPPEKEQTAIANALSDADTLITSLEKLIAKKRAIKTAAMQQLLTGKKRLPPFDTLNLKDGKPAYKQSELGEIPEDWAVVNLLDVANLIHGKAHEPFVVDAGDYTVVNSKFVSTEGKVRKTCNQNVCPARKGDVLMVLSDLPNGKALAKCYLTEQDNVYAVNQRVCIYRSKKIDPGFLFNKINRHDYFLGLDDGVTQTHILNGDIADCQIFIPTDKEEQRAIGQVIADMNSEITEIEQRLNKTQQLKQGMMQELLTGRTRLV